VLHPNRANVSKDELRQKLAELYKANKDQVSCFGFRTQYGGGKSTGFALIYDSHEALKKFEPHYRLVRYGVSSKVEKASRQQRTYSSVCSQWLFEHDYKDLVNGLNMMIQYRQATQEQSQDCEGYGEDKRRCQGEEEVVGSDFLFH
jgi:small subunit ribosomal protein S24e